MPIPYQSFGSCRLSDGYNSWADRKAKERNSYLRISEVVKSLLVGRVCFLEVVHHQMTVSCKHRKLCAHVVPNSAYPDYPIFRRCWRRSSVCFASIRPPLQTALASSKLWRFRSWPAQTIDYVAKHVRRLGVRRPGRPSVQLSFLHKNISTLVSEIDNPRLTKLYPYLFIQLCQYLWSITLLHRYVSIDLRMSHHGTQMRRHAAGRRWLWMTRHSTEGVVKKKLFSS
jgi:hypothetical protein